MNKNKKWSVVVGCLVKNDNKFLILKRGDNEDSYPGIWELPSGKVEFGETLEQAVRREVREETGLEIDNPVLYGFFQYQTEVKYSVQINFTANTDSQKVKLTEHEDFKFVSPDELDKYGVTH